MNKKLSGWIGVVLCVVVVSGSAVAADVDLKKLQAMVQREQDAREIQNLMSRRAHLQSINNNQGWVDLYARKQPDVSWYMNGRYRIGLEEIKTTFVPTDNSRAQRNLENMIKLYPDIENKPENYGVGEFREHALLSPLIEVAEDGKTAKGFWQSVGPQLAFANGQASGTLGFEKYAVDFIKEDGQWRFWHMATYTESYLQLGKTLAEQVPPPGTTKPAAAANAPINPYPEWSPWRVPAQVSLPVPYKTFAETFSYGPSAAEVQAALAAKNAAAK
ncbi:MAG: nuclear transport factor 2 family protein [Steroidobacteraceae bacterium]